MSFDNSSTRDSATGTGNASAPASPGKRTATAGLSAPKTADARAATGSASSTSTSTTLHGTGWLAGVLGFGGGGESEHHDKHKKHKHKHKHKHEHHDEHDDDVIVGGGEGKAGVGGEGDSEPGAADSKTGAGGRTDMPPRPDAPSSKAKLTIKSSTVKNAADGSGKSRTTVGVGEIVHFEGSKAGTWSANHGTRHSDSSKFFYWEAPDTATEATITLHSGNSTVSKTIRVVAPTTLAMRKYHEDSFPKGVQGAGMKTHVTIGPTSVCFGNVEWLEVPGGPTHITGYFAHQDKLNHHPNPNWLGWNDKNTGLWDHAWLSNFPKPWSKGGFMWVIPNKYRVAGKGSGHEFIHTHQVFHITDKKGTTTITKGGDGVRRTP